MPQAAVQEEAMVMVYDLLVAFQFGCGVVAFGFFAREGLRILRFNRAKLLSKRLFLAGLCFPGSVTAVGVLAHQVPLYGVGCLLGAAWVWLGTPMLYHLTGPVESWGLAWSDAGLRQFIAKPHASPLSIEDRTWLDEHLAGLEKWRSPETKAFIDLYRKRALAMFAEPPIDPAEMERLEERYDEEAKRVWATHLAQSAKGRLDD